MKFNKLKSLGHNFADSLSSGLGFMIGVYEMDIFAEAAAAKDGHITVDFLSGTTTGSSLSTSLRQAINLYRDELPNFCLKNSIKFTDIKTLVVRFGTDAVYGPHYTVTVANINGWQSTDQYIGIPGKRYRKAKPLEGKTNAA